MTSDVWTLTILSYLSSDLILSSLQNWIIFSKEKL